MNWFLVFEREGSHRAPGTVIVSGSPAGAGVQKPPPYLTFKPVMLVQANDGKSAIWQAAQKTRRMGEFFAVAVDAIYSDALPPEMPS